MRLRDPFRSHWHHRKCAQRCQTGSVAPPFFGVPRPKSSAQFGMVRGSWQSEFACYNLE